MRCVFLLACSYAAINVFLFSYQFISSCPVFLSVRLRLVKKLCRTLSKVSKEVIAPSLTEIFNASLSSGIVPNHFKTANITPILKSTSAPQDSPANHQPISLASILVLGTSSRTILPTTFPKLAGLHAPVLCHTHLSFRWPG